MGGWWKKLLRVNLASGLLSVEPLIGDDLALVIGGRGLGALLLVREVAAGVDPLSADNKLIFSVGPLTGTSAPTAGRMSLSTISPLTGAVHDSNAGGRLGAAIKRCGLDAIIIEGRSAVPVALVINDEDMFLVDARSVWGQTTSVVTEWLRSQISLPSVNGTACIGPAGAGQARIAAIIVDGKRALARGGVGAVAGSKNLVGMVVGGTKGVEIADQEQFDFARYEASKMLTANPMTARALPEFGTSILVNLLNELGALPAKNFTQSRFAGARNVSGEQLKKHVIKRSACWGCSIACGRVIGWEGKSVSGPEYETVWAFGPDCGNDDLGSIIAANLACNELGLDTISAGASIACAMELSGAGGLDLRFGDGHRIAGLLKEIAYRDGPGAVLADGARLFARQVGAAGAAMHVRGLELPAYDPRGLQGQGLALATSNRGGCHLRANMLGPEAVGVPKMVNRFQYHGRAGLVIVMQHNHAVVDSLITCKFAGLAIGDEHWARLLSAATGVDYSTQDIQQTGERIWHLERICNWRRGGDVVVDTLPDRLLSEPIADGPSAGGIVHLPEMLTEYYRFRGWDKQGRAQPDRLRRLGLTGEWIGGDDVAR